MLNFSLVHSWHIPVMGLNVGIFCSKILHVTFGWVFAATSFQKCVDRVVELSDKKK